MDVVGEGVGCCDARVTCRAPLLPSGLPSRACARPATSGAAAAAVERRDCVARWGHHTHSIAGDECRLAPFLAKKLLAGLLMLVPVKWPAPRHRSSR